jgi:sialic acid synthase SpsE
MRAVACLDKNNNIIYIYIIAEIGVNHNGSFINAKKMIVAAKKAGASAVKFQNFVPKVKINLKKNTLLRKGTSID